MAKTIQLTKGAVALVSDCDFEMLSVRKWQINGAGYAQSKINGRIIQMHRLILNAPENMDVDHANGCKIDNRRENIRLCTKHQNRHNARPKKGLIYRGVVRNGKSWRAAFKPSGVENYHLGTFSTPEAAARAYDKAHHAHDPEFAKLNFDDGLWSEEELSQFLLKPKDSSAGFPGVQKVREGFRGRYTVDGKRHATVIKKTAEEAFRTIHQDKQMKLQISKS